MNQKFTHLHTHSHYSLLDGLPKIDELLNYVKELGMDSVALTDHGVLYGAVEFYKKAKQLGIKPIIGSEVYIAYEKMEQKRPKIDDKRYHLVLLAKNQQGYKNLIKLITKAHLEGFYYKPRIDEDLLEQYADGLICLSACIQGKIPQLILSKKIDEAEKLALKYQKIFGRDSFYLEIQHHPNLPSQKKANQGIIFLSKKLNIPLVATNDVHYLKPEDAEAQDILMLINTGANPNDPERLTMKADDFSLRTPEQMKKDFKNIPQAIENTQKIVESCNLELTLGKPKLPYFPLLSDKNPDEYLKELCIKNLKKKYSLMHKKEAITQLNYELSIIKQAGLSSYFLIVQDFVNWAKQNGIVVGPGRGSVGGSLIAYLLNITNIDPLKYNLLFERFLNPGRAKVSLPDIDLDFADHRRDEVINYVSQKYGKDKVSQIITFGTMAARAVIRDVGRALGYTYSYCDKIAKMIPFGFTLEEALQKIQEFRDVYKNDQQAEKLINLAKKLEGVVRHVSTHACGVVISSEPLENCIPLQHPTQNDQNIVTQYDMNSVESLGLLKMDFLGLKNLTIIENTLNLINKNYKIKIKLENLPLNDKKTYQLLQKGETTSVFQLESEGMKKYLKQLKPTQFEDIVVMIALYRPGPMGFIPDYIQRKHKKKKAEYLHPKLKPILESTQGICIFQEQLMQIAQKLAGYSPAEADTLRKAVGKKIKNLLVNQKEKFITGLINNGIKKDIAEKIWERILPFARYGFNRAHSVAYAMIAYQTAYLKAHYPVEFMAAVLISEKADVERIAFLIEECQRMGIKVLPPDINESEKNFTVIEKKSSPPISLTKKEEGAKKQIRFGLTAIKNVGHNVVEAIIKERKKNGELQSIEDFVTRVDLKILNKKSLESLIKAGTFDRLGERGQLLLNIETLLEKGREIQRNKANGQRGLFDALPNSKQKIKFNNNNSSLPSASPASNAEMLSWEKELLGLYISSHPLQDYKNILEKKTISISTINNKNFLNRRIRIGGIISKIKKIITKNGKPMLFLSLEDLTDKIEVIAFPSIVEQNPVIFQENKIVLIQGKINIKDETPKIICEQIEEIINYESPYETKN